MDALESVTWAQAKEQAIVRRLGGGGGGGSLSLSLSALSALSALSHSPSTERYQYCTQIPPQRRKREGLTCWLAQFRHSHGHTLAHSVAHSHLGHLSPPSHPFPPRLSAALLYRHQSRTHKSSPSHAIGEGRTHTTAPHLRDSVPTLCPTARAPQHSTAQHSTAQHSTAPAQQSIALPCLASQHSQAPPSRYLSGL